MMRFLQSRLDQPIHLADLARFAHLSERACQRRFRECLNLTPMQYLAEAAPDARGRTAARGNADGDGGRHPLRISKSRLFCAALPRALRPLPARLAGAEMNGRLKTCTFPGSAV